MKHAISSSRRRAGGFTLVEVLIAVTTIGILSAVAVPQYFKVVEKPHAAEAVKWLSDLAEAQELRKIRTGTYYAGSTALDDMASALNFRTDLNGYTASNVLANGGTSWSVQLTRAVSVPGFGQYTITYSHAPNMFPPTTYNCDTDVCVAQLMPPNGGGGIIAPSTDYNPPPPILF